MPEAPTGDYGIHERPGKPARKEPARKRRAPSPPPANGRETEWLASCKLTKRGEPYANLANTMRALRSDPALSDVVAFDMMQHAAILARPMPSKVTEPNFEPRALRDIDVAQMQEFLQEAGIPGVSKDTAHQALDLRAWECAYHPVRDYLEGLKWDGKRRVHGWLTTYLGAERTPYTESIGAMFLVAMMARVYKPGCKADYMMVLEGEQGVKKSTACAVLAGRWYSDNLPDITTGGKDLKQHLTGKWVIEVAELSAMSRSEDNALKHFITRRSEEFRPPYGRLEILRPRQCVFIGTTNKPTYLRDETGGRRYWPVRTGEIDIPALERDRDQLLAEAATLFHEGARWWPDRAFEREHINPEQEARFEHDAWEELIAGWLVGQSNVTPTEVARNGLHMDGQRIERAHTLRIGAIMKRLGWRPTGKVDANSRRPWLRTAPP